MILYEAPHRLHRTLQELYNIFGNRTVTIIKELTKKHETIWKTTLFVAASHYETHEPKGEYVLIMEGVSVRHLEEERQNRWNTVSIIEHMKIYENQGMERKEAMKAVAKDRGLRKRDIYQILIKEENG